VNPKARRQAGSSRCGNRHPRDVRPDGDNDEETPRSSSWSQLRQDHGAGDADLVVPSRRRSIEQQLLGGRAPMGRQGKEPSQRPGVFGPRPDQMGNGFLQNLYGYEWELTKSPAEPGSSPQRRRRAGTIPTRSAAGSYPTCWSRTWRCGRTDLPPDHPAWLDHPEELSEAFAKAWYKLLHRDLADSRYLGPWLPSAAVAGPVPASTISWSTTRRCGLKPRSSNPVCPFPAG